MNGECSQDGLCQTCFCLGVQERSSESVSCPCESVAIQYPWDRASAPSWAFSCASRQNRVQRNDDSVVVTVGMVTAPGSHGYVELDRLPDIALQDMPDEILVG